MKVFVALLAIVAVAVAQPVNLPLVQLIVNVDAPAYPASVNPVAIDGPVETVPVGVNPVPIFDKPVPEPDYVPGPVNVVDSVEAEVEPIIVPEPVVLPAPVLPEVVIPEPVVLPEPVAPEVVVPESIPAGVVTPIQVVAPEEVIVAVPVVAPSVMDH